MRIREITPFLHASLYRYPRFESFEDIQTVGLHEWGVLSKETVNKIIAMREHEKANITVLHSDSTGNAILRPLVNVTEDCVKATTISSLQTQKVYSLEHKPDEFMVVSQQRSEPNSSGDLRSPSELVVGSATEGRNLALLPRCSTLFSPRKSDSLFWSMYIAKYGVGEFFEIGTKYMNKEIEEKSKIMEFMKANRPLLKSMKITSDKGQEIMGDLMTNKKTELTVVCAFALFYRTRIWVVSEDSRTYFEFLPNDSEDNTPIFLIYRTKPGGKRASVPTPSPSKSGLSYIVDTHVVEKTIIHIRDNMFRLESPSLHMKGISNYKITDLEKIITMLDITCPPEITKWKKTDMYNTIRLHCMTAWLD
jgi:hypothetical protein